MKRWWNSPQQRPVGGTRRRACRVLAPAMMAGAVCLALPRLTAEEFQLTLPRTSGAMVVAWAFATLSDPKQPNSEDACDLLHVCELALSSNGGAGTGTGATIKNDVGTSSQTDPAPNLPFTLTETIDYAHPVTPVAKGNSGQGVCYPANGVMTITADANSTLVLDLVGQACRVGQGAKQLVFTGSYVSDAASTGQFANVDGIGSVSINNPSGLDGHVDEHESVVYGPSQVHALASGVAAIG